MDKHFFIVLCPRYKDSYFDKACWPESWQKEATRLLKEEWAKYKPTPIDKSVVWEKPTVTFFFEMDTFNLDIAQDELDQYLSSPPETHCVDPIAHWNARLVSGSCLARMALDILSIPATSVDVERAFSRGRLTVSHLRHSLKDSSTRMATVLGSWAVLPELIPKANIIQSFRDKTK
ncbi:hypothetical protein M422DRAFT_158795 [Sphaerobolus stellatus SS14]|nr:hypothetical protein M422DRAFT_158795 [Sphaerobolus stellatus SS14]